MILKYFVILFLLSAVPTKMYHMSESKLID